MKTLRFVGVVLMALFACVNFVSCDNITNQPTIVNETYDTPIDSLRIRCKNLKGLGNLDIGKTTLQQVRRDKSITMPSILLKPTFSGGFWCVDDDKLSSYLNTKAKIIKQFEIGDCFYKYKIGDVEIEDVCLAFYRDTLVAISFDCSSTILNHYISKYGKGIGKHYEFTKIKGEYGQKNYIFEHTHKEEHTWMNEKVTMEYKYNWSQNQRQVLYNNKTCVISSNDKYEVFLTTLKEYKNKYAEEQELKRQESLNSL